MPARHRLGAGHVVHLDGAHQLARGTSAETDQPLAVLAEELSVYAGAVVEALQMRARGELDEAAIAGGITCEQGEMESPPVEGGIAVGAGPRRDIDLAADEWPDPGFLGRQIEVGGPVHDAVVGERDRVHPELTGALEDLGNATEPVEQAELTVNVQMRKVSHAVPPGSAGGNCRHRTYCGPPGGTRTYR